VFWKEDYWGVFEFILKTLARAPEFYKGPFQLIGRHVGRPPSQKASGVRHTAEKIRLQREEKLQFQT
jgi:hypothetical protein